MRASLWQLLPLVAVGWGFAVATDVVGDLDWDRGRERAVLLLVALLSIPWLRRRGHRPSRSTTRHVTTALAIACALLFTTNVARVVQGTAAEAVDIATATLAAARAMAEGHNPYTLEVDPHPELLPDRWREFAGYKYTPLMAVTYLPLGLPWGLEGVYATNLLLHGAVVALIVLLGARSGSRATGWFAACLTLAIGFAPFELYSQGATDLAALVPLLLALCFADRRPLVTGLLVGLSISTKLLPGALFVAVCLPREGRLAYTIGGALGLLPSLLFLLASPEAFVDNLVVFNLLRPTDSTSWLHWAPAAARGMAGFALGAGLLASGLWSWLRRPDLVDRVVLANACILWTLLLGPICHRNYLLWWLPLLALLVARATLVEEATLEDTA